MQSVGPMKFFSSLRRIGFVNEIRNYSKKTDIEKLKENIPLKPKKPSNPYLLFVKDVTPKLAAEHPDFSGIQLMESAGKLWREANDNLKDQYRKTFKTLREKYMEERALYENSLTPEQFDAIAKLNEYSRKKREQVKVNQVLKKLGKPKRPPNPFGIFVSENGSKIGPEETQLARFKRLSNEWKKLSEEKRDEYMARHKTLMEDYRKKMEEWESTIMADLDLKDSDSDDKSKKSISFDRTIASELNSSKNKVSTASKPKRRPKLTDRISLLLEKQKEK